MPINDNLLKKLLAMFRIEADGHLQAMSSGLCALEKTPPGLYPADIIETVFREVHSLKGAARAVNLTQIESVCQSMEAIFAALKNKRLAASPPLIDLLFRAVDTLAGLLAGDPKAGGEQKALTVSLIRQLRDALKGSLIDPANAPPVAARPQPPTSPDSSAFAPGRPAGLDTANEMPVLPAIPGLTAAAVRISTAKLDAVMRQVDELLLPRLKIGQHATELSRACSALGAWKKQRQNVQSTVRLIGRKLAVNASDAAAPTRHELFQVLRYLDAEQLHMKMLEERLVRLHRAAEHDQRMLAGMTDCLRQDVKEMQLLPFSSLLDIFPRFSRELAREQGKNIELAISGGEIEIDRHVLEEMKDPLIHLVRNCIDHGIEGPAVRSARGKSPHGTITIACSQKDSGTGEVLVSDDGAGIDIDQVKAAACKLGIISAEEGNGLGDLESALLAFHSGVSTSPIITEISGRGLGLAIVREKIERLGGGIVVKTTPGAGTIFHISLPLVRANFRGVIVRAGAHLFIIPSASVERTLRISDKDIQTVKNRETIVVEEKPVSLVWLSDVLELASGASTAEAKTYYLALVLKSGPSRIAFLVEEILGEQEVLVKAFARPLARIRNVAGASVLGTGQVVPVLNAQDLLKTAVKRSATQPISGSRSSTDEHKSKRKRSVLVVEDSITSRTLLKAILESAGYRVSTAVDGVDGYTALKTTEIDLVVSDVEMPRMDGFDLTSRIRADKQLADLPVILVTGLGSREDRERGIDVGANAYVVKSSFDQSNLLEIIQRLIRA
jgi:two-component system chemotaxis sensor kinase CheA